MALHPVMAMALAPFTPEGAMDHAAYGRCEKGHVLSRFDSKCHECERLAILASITPDPMPVPSEEALRLLIDPRSHRTLVLCDCHQSTGDPLPDPRCVKCGGSGEIEVPF